MGWLHNDGVEKWIVGEDPLFAFIHYSICLPEYLFAKMPGPKASSTSHGEPDQSQTENTSNDRNQNSSSSSESNSQEQADSFYAWVLRHIALGNLRRLNIAGDSWFKIMGISREDHGERMIKHYPIGDISMNMRRIFYNYNIGIRIIIRISYFTIKTWHLGGNLMRIYIRSLSACYGSNGPFSLMVYLFKMVGFHRNGTLHMVTLQMVVTPMFYSYTCHAQSTYSITWWSIEDGQDIYIYMYQNKLQYFANLK